MNDNLTFAMVKPSAVADNNIGGILEMIEKDGFVIKGMKMTKLTKERASKFYEVHKERPFYDTLCTIMSSGPIVALALQKDSAVESFRNLIGATNPADAEEGTIRKKYGKSLDENAVHGSDSNENAAIETKFFFTDEELYR